jgi:hypothetical protein
MVWALKPWVLSSGVDMGVARVVSDNAVARLILV